MMSKLNFDYETLQLLDKLGFFDEFKGFGVFRGDA